MKVRVYVRPKVAILLLRKKGLTMTQVAVIWGVSVSRVHCVLQGKESVGLETERRIWDLFRGLSHKQGGRTVWDDLFQRAIFENV